MSYGIDSFNVLGYFLLLRIEVNNVFVEISKILHVVLAGWRGVSGSVFD